MREQDSPLQVDIIDRFRRVKRVPLFESGPTDGPGVRAGELEYRKVGKTWQRSRIFNAEGEIADVFTNKK